MNDCLPILTKPREDESATGFLTRAFAMNRTRAMTVYRWLGLSWTSQLKHSDLPALARATDMPVDWFTHRVPVEMPTGRWHWSWLGQQWKGHQTVRAPGQRLCPSCVHQNGSAKLAWDLGFYAACPIHQTVLLERCNHCERRVRWHRPAIDVCACKRHFHAGMETDLGSLTTSWLQWVADSLTSNAPLLLPPDLSHLFPGRPSVDGIWRVISAFGVRPDALTAASNLSTSSAMPLNDTLHVTQRGLARLHRLTQGAPLKDEIHVSALRWQALGGIDAADRNLAHHALQMAGVHFTPGRRSKYADGQLELFP